MPDQIFVPSQLTVVLEFFQFPMEKKDSALEMETLYDFLSLLTHIRPFDVISHQNKANLPDTYMSKVDNKTLEQDVKLA